MFRKFGLEQSNTITFEPGNPTLRGNCKRVMAVDQHGASAVLIKIIGTAANLNHKICRPGFCFFKLLIIFQEINVLLNFAATNHNAGSPLCGCRLRQVH